MYETEFSLQEAKQQLKEFSSLSGINTVDQERFGELQAASEATRTRIVNIEEFMRTFQVRKVSALNIFCVLKLLVLQEDRSPRLGARRPEAGGVLTFEQKTQAMLIRYNFSFNEKI